MLSVAFLEEAQEAVHVNNIPLHTLGIKASLYKLYEGQPD
jgi:hypothetical protein